MLPIDSDISYGLTFRCIYDKIRNSYEFNWELRGDIIRCLHDLEWVDRSIVKIDYGYQYRYYKRKYKRRWGKI